MNRSGQPYVPVDALPASATPKGVLGLMSIVAEWRANIYNDTHHDVAQPGGVLIDPQAPATMHCRPARRPKASSA